MRNLIITLVMFVAIGFSAFAVGKDANDNKGKAVASFETTTHDFGYIKEKKGIVTCEFKFTNNGNAPLLIIETTASCGCTRPEFPKKPIKPGKSGKIKVSYNPAGRPGPFRKEIKVRNNGKKKTVTLYIEGSVVE